MEKNFEKTNGFCFFKKIVPDLSNDPHILVLYQTSVLVVDGV